MRCGCILHASRGTPDGTTISWIICGPLLSHWRATERSGVCTAPLFENTGLVIRPNLHRDSEGEVGGGAELFWWFHSIESLKYIPLMKISKIGGGAEFARNWIYKERGWVEIARKGIFKERPHNSHPCEYARNGFIQEIKKWNPHGTVFARKGISKEWTLQGMRAMLIVESITVP